MFDGNLFFDYNSNLNYDFVRSGDIDPSNSKSEYIGERGYGWSANAADYAVNSTGAYYLDIFDAIDPSHGPSTRWYGLPVRCLV